MPDQVTSTKTRLSCPYYPSLDERESHGASAEMKRASALGPPRSAPNGAFAGAGLAFATWASRVPQVQQPLNLSPAELGLVLLSVAAGSLIAAGIVVHRLGSRRTVTIMALMQACSLAVVSLGYHLAATQVLVCGLFIFGLSSGAWDVAANVQGATVELRLGRAVMSRFHAAFSLGTFAGALLGSGLIAVGIPVSVHLLAIGAGVGICVPIAASSFVADTNAEDASGSPSRTANAWIEPRTVLLGFLVLAFAFAEGTGNDWISVALIHGQGVSTTFGTLGYGLFLAAVTTVRWFTPAVLDRFGRVLIIRLLCGVGIVGLLLFVFSHIPVLAFLGAVFWGAGIALGFPAAMSAAADDPTSAPARVSVVSSIGYCAFLAGPPVIGVLGDSVGVLHAVSVTIPLLLIAFGLTGLLRPTS